MQTKLQRKIVEDVRNHASLAAALTAVGATSTEIALPGGWSETISADLTVPANVTLRAHRGALLSVATGVTLTIAGGLSAHIGQVFSGAGTVRFAPGARIPSVRLEWWGAKPDSGVTDCRPALIAAVNSLKSRGGTVKVSHGGGGYFGISDGVHFAGDEYSGITITGEGWGSWIKHTAVTGSTLSVLGIAGNTAYALKDVTIKALRISGYSDSNPAYTQKAMLFGFCDGVTLDRVKIDTTWMEGIYFSAPANSRNVTLRGCYATRIGMSGLSAYNLNANRATITGCSAYDVGQFIEQTGYEFVCKGNRFDKASTYGINMFSTWSGWQESGITKNSRRAVVTGNTIHDCPVGVVFLDPTGTGGPGFGGNVGECIIADNTFTSCRQAALLGSTTGVTHFRGNHCTPNAASAAKAAVQIQDGTTGPCIITENVFHRDGSYQWSILVNASASNAAHLIARNTSFGQAWNGSAYAIGGPGATVDRNLFQPNGDTLSGSLLSVLSASGNGQNLSIDTGDVDPSFPITYGMTSVRSEYRGATPAALTWKRDDIRWTRSVAAAGYIGEVCTSPGTAGTLNGGATTATTTSGSPNITFSSAAGLYPGARITIAGVSGVKTLVSITGTAGVLDSVASAGVSGAAVAYSAPVFKTFGAVSA